MPCMQFLTFCFLIVVVAVGGLDFYGKSQEKIKGYCSW